MGTPFSQLLIFSIFLLETFFRLNNVIHGQVIFLMDLNKCISIFTWFFATSGVVVILAINAQKIELTFTKMQFWNSIFKSLALASFKTVLFTISITESWAKSVQCYQKFFGRDLALLVGICLFTSTTVEQNWDAQNLEQQIVEFWIFPVSFLFIVCVWIICKTAPAFLWCFCDCVPCSKWHWPRSLSRNLIERSHLIKGAT